MNKFLKWHYNKISEKMDNDAEANGLRVVDSDKWHQYKLYMAKKDLRNNVALIILALIVLINWIIKWKYGG